MGYSDISAYALTDGLEEGNTTGGNDDSAVLAPEFAFDEATVPMLFIHGDADGWAAMNSVKSWERLRDMNLQSELHTLALRPHCFQRTASPGTGSHSWLGGYLISSRKKDSSSPAATDISSRRFPRQGYVIYSPMD